MTVVYSPLQRILPIVSGGTPPWIPPIGQYGGVPANNTALSVNPTGFSVPNAESSIYGMFVDWGAKGIVIPDWNGNPLLPGVGVYSSGHTGDGFQSPFVLVFNTDPNVLAWVTRNVPVRPDGSPVQWPSTFVLPQKWTQDQEWNTANGAEMAPGATALGVPCQSTTPGHTYTVPIVLPASAGGGPQGTLIYQNPLSPGTDGFGNGANPPYPCVHGLDLSKATMGHSRITPSGVPYLFSSTSADHHAGTTFWYGHAYDPTRNCIWALTANAFGGGLGNCTVRLQGWGPGITTTDQTQFVDGGPYGSSVCMLRYYQPADLLLLWTNEDEIWAKIPTGTTAAGTGWKKMGVSGTSPFNPNPRNLTATSITGNTINVPTVGNLYTGAHLFVPVSGHHYWAILVSPGSFQIASSYANAVSNTPLALTGGVLTDAQSQIRVLLSSSWPADWGLCPSQLMPDSYFVYDNGGYNNNYFPYTTPLPLNPSVSGRVFRLRVPSGTQAQILAGATGPFQWTSQDCTPKSGYSFPWTLGDGNSPFFNGTMGSFVEVPGWGVPGISSSFVVLGGWNVSPTVFTLPVN